jgi:pimeloyl-ACP methyl ester carboxylesterase
MTNNAAERVAIVTGGSGGTAQVAAERLAGDGVTDFRGDPSKIGDPVPVMQRDRTGSCPRSTTPRSWTSPSSSADAARSHPRSAPPAVPPRLSTQMKEPHAKHHQIERAVAAAAWASLLVLTLTGATNSGAQPAPHSAAAKPTIVLVHGDWADGSSWAAVTENLQRKGFTVDVLANPLRGVNSDASYLRDYLATVSGPIVLVGHSYGGMVITNAATGNPNVKELVYIGQPVGGRDLLHGRTELASDLGERVALDHRVQLVALHPAMRMTDTSVETWRAGRRR